MTLGGTAQIIGRVAAGVATGGVSEAVRYGVKQGSKSVGMKRDTLGRIVSGVSTGGASEVVRYGSTALGQKLGIDPAIAEQGLSLGRLQTNQTPNAPSNLNKALDTAGAMSASVATKPDEVVKPDAPIGQTEEEKQRLARVAEKKRRKEFENLGRSSTLMTGPGGLAGAGPGKGKTLLGY